MWINELAANTAIAESRIGSHNSPSATIGASFGIQNSEFRLQNYKCKRPAPSQPFPAPRGGRANQRVEHAHVPDGVLERQGDGRVVENGLRKAVGLNR